MTVNMIAAFVTSVLSGIGVGSGGLLVAWLVTAGGAEQTAAQGANLIVFMFSAGASLAISLRRRKIFPRTVIPICAAGIPGAIGGSILSGMIEASLLKRIFGGLLIISGLLTLAGCVKGGKRERADKSKIINK